MMQLSFTATVEQFDRNAYILAVQAEVRRVFFKAGQKFLLAAIPRIPIWTGMARGALRNLEDVVGKVTRDAQSGGYRIRATRGRGVQRGGGTRITRPFRRAYYYYPPGGARVLRTPQAGRQFATPSNDIMSLTGATLASGRTSFYFRFKVDITYFNILDSARWGAWKAGADALEKYVKDNLSLPDPLEFMTRTIVK